MAEESVEIAPTEACVAAVREAKSILKDSPSQRAKHAGLPHARLAQEQHALLVGDGFLDVVDEADLALWEPEIGVFDFC